MNNVFKNALLGFSRQEEEAVEEVTGYQIPRSLRFNSADSTHLSWIPLEQGNKKTLTFSFWIKRSTLGVAQPIFEAGTGASYYSMIWFDSDDTLHLPNDKGSGGIPANDGFSLKTSQVFRDVSSWYHFVVAYDTTQSTESNRVKIYVNGSQITNFSGTYPPINHNTFFNDVVLHYISERVGSNSYLNGYLAEIHFVDGQQLSASDFGETDETTGVWKPKEYTGSYGTNGYYLPFSNNFSTSTLGLSAVPYTTDQGWNRTTLLVKTNETDGAQNNTFVDSSTNNFTITRNGNTTQGQFSPFAVEEGKWSNYFNGSSRFDFADNAAWDLGTTWTAEGWFYPNTTSAGKAAATRRSTSTANQYDLFIFSGGIWKFEGYGVNGTSGPVGSTNTYPAGRWYHIAIVTSGGSTKLYVNGVLDFTYNNNFSWTSSYGMAVGGSPAFSEFWNGAISNLRIVKGTALYTSNFDPPTEPLTNIANTVLLTCQNRRFVDNSNNSFALTAVSTPKVTAFNPFTPTQDYSASVNGGSAYFDGTGDYITAPNNSSLIFGTNDFTVEAWVYLNSLGADRSVYDCRASTNSVGAFYISGSNNTVAFYDGSVTATGTALTANTWNHVAWVRSGTTLYGYLNGVQQWSRSLSTNVTSITTPRIGADRGGSLSLMSGFISSCRVVNGTALYTSNFTPSTSPFTNITNTSLLLNFINAGIVDATGLNNLETIGDAQVDTAVTKWGSSVKFDGTGDRAVITQDNPDIKVWWLSDFTIEYWVYGNAWSQGSNGHSTVLAHAEAASAGEYWSFGPISNGTVRFYWWSGSANSFNAGSVGTGSWHHLAFTKQGSTLRIFINGSLSATTTLSNTPQYGTGTPIMIGTGANGTGFNGYVEDLRITKGLARYTDNFTLPDAPFAYDKSDINYKQWIPNNFSVSAGAGNDSVVDTPTPYGEDTGVGGEVRGNYCVLNPLQPSSGTITNGGLSLVTVVSGGYGGVGTIAVPSSGKWYWEAIPTNNGSDGFMGIYRIVNSTYVAYYGYSGDKYINGTSSSYGATYTNNDVIGVAVNVDTSEITFYKNGSSQGTFTFDTSSGEYVPYFNDGTSARATTYNINFGQQPFVHAAPSGFKALCTTNLPTPTIADGSEYFNTILWAGDNTTSRTISGVGFQPDLVWAKRRSPTGDHGLMDAIRGATARLISNSTAAEDTSFGLSAFTSDGFTTNASNTAYNGSGESLVAWNWNAGGSNATNTDGTITSTVRANPTAGFSIISYAGNQGSDFTIGHGLGKQPSMFISKPRNASGEWGVYYTMNGTNTNWLVLNSTNGQGSNTGTLAGGAFAIFSSSTIQIGSTAYANSENSMIGYAFAEIEGYSKFGTYTGNGSTDGPFVYCGFRPRFIMTKRTDSTSDWGLYDTERDTYNAWNKFLVANTTGAEGTATFGDILSNGFKWRYTGAMNASSGTYIFAAFAENPFKYSLAR